MLNVFICTSCLECSRGLDRLVTDQDRELGVKFLRPLMEVEGFPADVESQRRRARDESSVSEGLRFSSQNVSSNYQITADRPVYLDTKSCARVCVCVLACMDECSAKYTHTLTNTGEGWPLRVPSPPPQCCLWHLVFHFRWGTSANFPASLEAESSEPDTHILLYGRITDLSPFPTPTKSAANSCGGSYFQALSFAALVYDN